MGEILRHDDDNYDYEGNVETVRRHMGRRLRVDNNDSLDNRSTTTKEGGWDPPHPLAMLLRRIGGGLPQMAPTFDYSGDEAMDDDGVEDNG